ncbi:hypothetical protein Lesp02_52430 [Lentzea sp. NBRC 105346]|uniref:hypothetical protein n=1 Tax=Lentzea sp. NBRC 105346 TaxID=3032205 RepID=UPI0024A372A6|nr:hypothetical protein [Lentzea sp. NBRC 105346]GLZ33055.1 hypothetical protein Lesp02_52430 [Lentzea sp. NBRC 105346]
MKRLLVLALVLAACAPSPRALTTGEAERLALVRFSNYSTGVTGFTAAVPSAGGKLLLDGRVDFVNHLGYAGMQTEGRSDEFSRGLLQWNLKRLAYAMTDATKPVEPLPQNGWQVRDLQEKGSELDGALRLLVNLGADRPDNAQLLLQSSARWLRTDRYEDVEVDVLEGPGQNGKDSRLRYWVDADGKLRRLEARLGGQEDFAIFDFTGSGAPLPIIPPLR